MTLQEFKAWLEGYTEGIEGAPTAAQFARIKEKMKQITGTPITQTVFIEKYAPWSRPYQPYQPYWADSIRMAAGTGPTSFATDYQSKAGVSDFDSVSAMYALGKAEAVN